MWPKIAITALGILALGAAPSGSKRRSAVVEAVEKVSPAVVSVSVQMVVSSAPNPFAWFFHDFVPRERRRLETVSEGSGVIIDAAGYVLTNYHVISAGGTVTVELDDDRRFEGAIVGTAPDQDLAVLKIEAGRRVSFVPMGTSRDLMIGEPVIAIGNPFGLSHTVTTGVVSALHRSLQTEERIYNDFIQTDASINPGNSGGPLLNIEGELIGVNTAIYGKAQGIGFAIPIDKARRIVDDLLRHGEVRRPYFGFESQDLSSELAESLGSNGRGGALVAEVDNRGPATAKLREGDIITAIDGVKVSNADELRHRLGDYTPGVPVTISLLRQGERREARLVAVTLDANYALKRAEQRTGLRVVELSPDERKRLGIESSLLVVERVAPSSQAAKAGIRRGDLVRAVNAERVGTTRAFGKAMAGAYWRGQVTLLIQRGRVWQHIAFNL